MISLFVHGLMKIDILQEMSKDSKRFMGKVNLWLNIWWNRTEKISYMLRCSKKRAFIFYNLSISEYLHFKEIIDLMPFHVFLMFSRLVLKW